MVSGLKSFITLLLLGCCSTITVLLLSCYFILVSHVFSLSWTSQVPSRRRHCSSQLSGKTNCSSRRKRSSTRSSRQTWSRRDYILPMRRSDLLKRYLTSHSVSLSPTFDGFCWSYHLFVWNLVGFCTWLTLCKYCRMQIVTRKLFSCSNIYIVECRVKF